MPYSNAVFWVDFERGRSRGVIASVTGFAPGSGYAAGDLLDIAGGTGGRVEVLTVGGGGAVTSMRLVRRGQQYTAGTKATSGGSGSGSTVTITVDGASDATRSTLTSVAFSNSSGLVHGTKAAHGLVTGAVVTVSGTTNFNGNWKVTVLTSSTFTLDGSTWIAGGTTTGSVVPFGGASLDDPWATIGSGATAARIAPGDEVRLVKSPPPVSIGQATWTNGSRVVTLAGPTLTKPVDACDSGWVRVGGSPPTGSYQREGAAAFGTYRGSSWSALTKQAYKDFPLTDFSAYDAISLWYRALSATGAVWDLCLCSDTLGDVVVDSIRIGPAGGSSRWQWFTAGRAGGGRLGSAIQSVSLWTTSSLTGFSAGTSSSFWFDNIIACNHSGLHLGSLISKSSDETGAERNESAYAIQAINGNTVYLDTQTETLAGVGLGYPGATETVETYIWSTVTVTPQASATGSANTVADSGTASAPLRITGGWDWSTLEQDGLTVLDGSNGFGVGLNVASKSYLDVERIAFTRFGSGLSLVMVGHSTFDIPFANNCTSRGLYIVTGAGNNDIAFGHASRCGTYGLELLDGAANNRITGTGLNENTTAGAFIHQSSRNELRIDGMANNGSYGLSLKNLDDLQVYDCVLSGNATAQVYAETSRADLIGCTMVGTEVSTGSNYTDTLVRSHDHGLSGEHWWWSPYVTVQSLAADFPGATGRKWRVTISSTARDSGYPMRFPLAGRWCAADTTVEVSLDVQKSHATNIAAQLVALGGEVSGIPSDVVDLAADSTAVQTLTVSVTPTATGYVRFELWVWSVSSTGYVDLDTLAVEEV